jgi:hypothetical protein
MAAATEDAFDAAVSALEMMLVGDALRRLPDGDDIDHIEGRTDLAASAVTPIVDRTA